MDVLLPGVELSHDWINVLVFKRPPAGFGCRQLHKTQNGKDLNVKARVAVCAFVVSYQQKRFQQHLSDVGVFFSLLVLWEVLQVHRQT